MKMEKAEYSETSAHKIHKPGIHPIERIQHSNHSEILKKMLPEVGVALAFVGVVHQYPG